MTDSFALLNRELRFYIHEKGWPVLTKIQNASIKTFFANDNNLILSAATASGKTEAAFLPAISKVTSWESGLKILYISPLIALINDQFRRITDMCFDMDIPITSWHGEASQARKDRIIEDPRGIALITPESIEALFANKPDVAKRIFADVEYIIVDEIHSFLFGNRGLQLKSLLERILRYTYEPPRMIGLSATIGEENYELAMAFFNNGRDTNIILDKTSNDLEVTYDYFPSDKISIDAVEKLHTYANEGPMLVFPNARDKVETLSVELGRLIKEKGDEIPVFAHHSSVGKKRRGEIETFAQEANGARFIIVATSTLELGIDIGTVTSVAQYGPAHSVLSLAQRLGRSGRKTRLSILHQISSNPWDLLESLATVSLYEDKILDKIDPTVKAYDVFAHQVLSTLLENYGLSHEEYNYLNKSLASFADISNHEFAEITHYMESEGYIEILENEVITGLNIEKLMRLGNFYNHFGTSQVYKVYSEKGLVGEVDIRPEIQVDSNIYLAGSVWRIVQIMSKNKKIMVEKANAGKAPRFSGIGEMDISPIIRTRMKQILEYPDMFIYPDEIKEVLEDLREEYTNDDYLFVASKDEISLRSFKSTKINRTLAIMLNIAAKSTKFVNYEADSTITGPDLIYYFDQIKLNPVGIEQIRKFFADYEEFVDAILAGFKYMMLVPMDLRIEYIINNRLDLDGAYEYLHVDTPKELGI